MSRPIEPHRELDSRLAFKLAWMHMPYECSATVNDGELVITLPSSSTCQYRSIKIVDECGRICNLWEPMHVGPRQLVKREITVMSRRVSQRYTTNPKTGREIQVGGPTYLELARDPKYADQLVPKPTAAQRKGSNVLRHSYSNSKRGGCSNQSKHAREGLPRSAFCGPEGGACEYTFPVNTPGRARAALAYRRHSPDPDKLEACVIRVAKKKGWYDAKTGTIKVKETTANPRRASKRKSNDQLSKNTSRSARSARSSKGKASAEFEYTKTRKHAFGCGCGV